MWKGMWLGVGFAALMAAGCSSESSSPPASQGDAGLEDSSAPFDGSQASDGQEQSDAPDAQSDRYRHLSEVIEAERQQLGAPGVAVLVMERGQITFAKGFGSKHPEQSDPVKETTLFRIGSVTKMLTAAALLQQVEQNKVQLEAPITEYLPDFRLTKNPDWAPSMKVKHLLTHATSMVDYMELDWPQKDDSQLEGFLLGSAFESGMYLMATSGRMWNYSNPNFMLAGLVTEKMAAVPYRTYMKEHLFTPLQMNRTFFLGDEVLADGDYAFGKTVSWEAPVGQPKAAGPKDYDNPWARPAGYAYSSVLDLARFASFLMHGEESVLSNELRLEMQRAQIDTEQYLDLIHYGYGLMVQKGFVLGSHYYSVPLISHGGDIPGFAADLYTIPSQDFAFITLANADGAHFQNSLVTALSELVDLPAAEPAPDPQVNPADFSAFTGTYDDHYGVGTITVRLQGQDVMVDVPYLDSQHISYEHKLEPVVKNNFVFTITDTPLAITFLFDSTGKVEYLRNRLFVGKYQEPTDGGTARSKAGNWSRQEFLRRLHQVDQSRPVLLPAARISSN